MTGHVPATRQRPLPAAAELLPLPEAGERRMLPRKLWKIPRQRQRPVYSAAAPGCWVTGPDQRHGHQATLDLPM